MTSLLPPPAGRGGRGGAAAGLQQPCVGAPPLRPPSRPPSSPFTNKTLPQHHPLQRVVDEDRVDALCPLGLVLLDSPVGNAHAVLHDGLRWHDATCVTLSRLACPPDCRHPGCLHTRLKVLEVHLLLAHPFLQPFLRGGVMAVGRINRVRDRHDSRSDSTLSGLPTHLGNRH